MIKKFITWLKSFLGAKNPEHVKETNVKVIEDFVSSKKHQKNAKVLAQSVQISCGNHWFSAKKMAGKFKMSQVEAIKQLELLCVFKLCASRVIGGNRKQYRIVLDENTAKELIQIEIDQCLERIEVLKKQL